MGQIIHDANSGALIRDQQESFETAGSDGCARVRKRSSAHRMLEGLGSERFLPRLGSRIYFNPTGLRMLSALSDYLFARKPRGVQPLNFCLRHSQRWCDAKVTIGSDRRHISVV